MKITTPRIKIGVYKCETAAIMNKWILMSCEPNFSYFHVTFCIPKLSFSYITHAPVYMSYKYLIFSQILGTSFLEQVYKKKMLYGKKKFTFFKTLSAIISCWVVRLATNLRCCYLFVVNREYIPKLQILEGDNLFKETLWIQSQIWLFFLFILLIIWI